MAEVDCILESLNAQWIIVEDVPAILSFLDTRVGNEVQAWSKWRNNWDHVDFASRKHILGSNPYYAKTRPFA